MKFWILPLLAFLLSCGGTLEADYEQENYPTHLLPDGATKTDAPGVCQEDLCGTTCTDLSSDPNNCGACGARCRSGVCEAGSCQFGDSSGGGEGTENPGGGSETDPGNNQPATCPGANEEMCAGQCIDTTQSSQHCGGCNHCLLYTSPSPRD